MNDIMKIIQALAESNILLKGFTKTIKNETKGQKGRYLGMLLGTLGAALLGNMLTGKGILSAGYDNKEGKRVLRAAYGNKEGKGVLRADYASKEGKGVLRVGYRNKMGS